jgi:hypothetical protein
MTLILILAAAAIFFALASRERPMYEKDYLQTRADGVFRTRYRRGFDEYLEYIEGEVRARQMIGPFSPTDDLHADLYHPETAQNWPRALDRWHFIRKSTSASLTIGSVLLVADGLLHLIVHGHHDILGLYSESDNKNIVALIAAIAVATWLGRHRTATSQTQGYLDGYSDAYRKSYLTALQKFQDTD